MTQWRSLWTWLWRFEMVVGLFSRLRVDSPSVELIRQRTRSWYDVKIKSIRQHRNAFSFPPQKFEHLKFLAQNLQFLRTLVRGLAVCYPFRFTIFLISGEMSHQYWIEIRDQGSDSVDSRFTYRFCFYGHHRAFILTTVFGSVLGADRSVFPLSSLHSYLYPLFIFKIARFWADRQNWRRSSKRPVSDRVWGVCLCTKYLCLFWSPTRNKMLGSLKKKQKKKNSSTRLPGVTTCSVLVFIFSKFMLQLSCRLYKNLYLTFDFQNSSIVSRYWWSIV